MLRNFEFRIYPSKTQQSIMTDWMVKCCELYNACLEQRKSAWSHLKHKSPEDRRGRMPNFISQSMALREIKIARPEFKTVYAQVLLDPVDRVQKAFDGFFRRVKTGATKVGYPRFKSRDRYNTFSYPQAGFKLTPSAGIRNGRLKLSKIGDMPVKDWKVLPDGLQPKRVTIKRIAGRWFAVLCCELPDPTPLAPTGKNLGLDAGLSSIVIDSDGGRLGNLEQLKSDERALRRTQREVSRKKKGSGRRRAAVKRLQVAHARLARQRKYQLHQIANDVIKRADLIGIERLEIKKMVDRKRATPVEMTKSARRGMRRNIHQAAWGQLDQMLSYKAEEAGRQLIQVSPRGTSQTCSACGRIVAKTLDVRRHICSCGLDIDRDHNAAINILQRALLAPCGAGSCNRPAVKRRVCRKRLPSCATSLNP
jgi:putative transposase